MEVKAKLNNIRMAPRKVRLVSNLIKGKSAIGALNQLNNLTKKSGLPLIKLINSALSNAENNFNSVKENMIIKSLFVDEGVKLKRFKPKGFGRVSLIQKKTSNITLILDEKIPGLRAKAKIKEEKKPTFESIAEPRDAKPAETETFKEGKRPEVKKELGRKESAANKFVRRIFRRKSI